MKNNCIVKQPLYLLILLLLMANCEVLKAQISITHRKRPVEWGNLVKGGRFLDRFQAMPNGRLSKDTWGDSTVIPRYVDNGIEDCIRSYWGGKIVCDSLFHLFVCGWPEDSPQGFRGWKNSIVYHATCRNSIGPYIIQDTIGLGHNPEIFQLDDGRYVIYVIGGYYLSDNLYGPWTKHKFIFDARDRRIIEGLSNLTFVKREDGSILMVCRGGGVWISKNGLSTYYQVTDRSIYPLVEGKFEDPVIWRDSTQYHLVVNDWYGRIAYYLRSKDGINWVVDPGEAYTPEISFHTDGNREKWFKYERMKVFQDGAGRVVQANFGVLDTEKHLDKANDNHSSKNISIPLNPGVLIEILNSDKVTSTTKTIQLRIKAEKGFNPQTDVQINTLRFGTPSEVDYGKGSKVQKVSKEGKDLIVTFDAPSKISSDDFVLKLLGARINKQLVFGYVRLPYLPRFSPILSARKPTLIHEAFKDVIEVVVENFGLAKSSEFTHLEINYREKDQLTLVGKVQIPSLLPYQKTILYLTVPKRYNLEDNPVFQVSIISDQSKSSTFFEPIKLK